MYIISFSEWSISNIWIRIVVATVLGIIIGLDRGVKRRGGGARTTTTVCLGAALIMLLEQYLMQTMPGTTDMTRMSAQVVSGVGFLGAGMILVSGHQIKGLTSAAGIWFSACVGLAAGIGFLDGAVIITVILLVVLHLIPYLEAHIYSHSRYMTLYLEVDDGRAIGDLLHKLKDDGCIIDTFDVDKPKAKGLYCTILSVIYCPEGVSKEDYMLSLRDIEGVISVYDM